MGNVGLRAIPFYLTLESAQDGAFSAGAPKMDSLETAFFSPGEIARIYAHPETAGYAGSARNFGSDDCRCFGLKREGEILAFTWCNLTRCLSPYATFQLKQNEAYLFDAYTYDKYRGANLAPYLRNCLYRELGGIGRDQYYSITEYFNAPAVAFKKKLKARHLKLSLYLSVLHTINRSITLKKYGAD